MWSKEQIFEEFAGDLEFNPRRGVIYASFAAISLLFWWRVQIPGRFAFAPQVIGYGGLALLLKAVFLFRRSSSGFGATREDLMKKADSIPHSSRRMAESSAIEAAGRLMQDFGVGPLLLWPFLALGSESPEPLLHLKIANIAAGAMIFVIGFATRKAAEPKTLSST